MDYNVKGDWFIDFRNETSQQNDTRHAHSPCSHSHSPPKEKGEKIQMIQVPFLGRIQCVQDTQGMIQISIIYFYWIYGIYSTYGVVLLPQYNEGRVSLAFLLVYGFIAANCIVALVKASTTNPGRIPLPEAGQDTSSWTFCEVCERKRPAQSHHCRRCKQCVLRMDHHCPWINNCVGEANHWAFMLLIFYAFLLSATTLCINMLHFYVYPECTLCDKESFPIKHARPLMITAIIMASMMSLGSFFLVMGQHINFLLERTTIDALKDPWPADMRMKRSCKSIYADVCGPPPVWKWLLACRRGGPQFQNYNYIHPV